VDCELGLYLLLIQWLSKVYRCTSPATVTNPHIVLYLGSKETHIQPHDLSPERQSARMSTITNED